jgi:hypothetical protein
MIFAVQPLMGYNGDRIETALNLLTGRSKGKDSTLAAAN